MIVWKKSQVNDRKIKTVRCIKTVRKKDRKKIFVNQAGLGYVLLKGLRGISPFLKILLPISNSIRMARGEGKFPPFNLIFESIFNKFAIQILKSPLFRFQSLINVAGVKILSMSVGSGTACRQNLEQVGRYVGTQVGRQVGILTILLKSLSFCGEDKKGSQYGQKDDFSFFFNSRFQPFYVHRSGNSRFDLIDTYRMVGGTVSCLVSSHSLAYRQVQASAQEPAGYGGHDLPEFYSPSQLFL